MSIWAGKAEEAASTWIELLQARAAERPEDRAYTFLAEGEEEAGSLTYAGLEARARALAARMQQLGLAGERALLLYPPGLDFVAAFLGCLYAGVVAVPAYPPRSARMLPRLVAIARDARPALALTTSELLESSRSLVSRMPELAAVRWLATDDLDVPALAADWREPEVDGDTLAFLQYTSGSTSLPKGVMVTHGNLLHNEAMIRTAFRQSESSTIVGWLPLYHDMGLIGNVLQPLYLGVPCVLMSPVAFLQRPLRWLRAISRYRATTSGGPNFAYDLCVKRISPAERHGLDLSSWELAFNGAEPVRADTLERFAEAFGPFGFRREAFYPCYGLAEATLFVSGGAATEQAVVSGFRAEDLERGRVTPAAPAADGSRWLVGCGTAWGGQDVAIVNPETGQRCMPDEVGEIWVTGSSVAKGYWGREEDTAKTFQATLAGDPAGLEGRFLRTGDLGFLSGGELYVTGRLKDLIILRGRNLYPQDLELTAERSHPALRPGCGAAFSVDAGGEERLILVSELERRREGESEAAAEAVRRAVAEEHEAQVHDVVLVRMGSVPKTSSGKIQRHACRAAYLAGDLEVVGRSALSLEEEAEAPAAPAALDRSLLAALAPAERRAALESWLAVEAGRALGLPASRVDPSRPLTALGLDSLGAVEIKSRAEEALGVEVSLGALLEGVSLAGLAVDVLERLAEAPEAVPAAELAPLGEETGEFPLSFGQRGLWYLHRLAPESLAYHLAGAGRVKGPLDVDALARAFQALVERHPSLRTTFGETARGPVQRVHAALAPEILILDLSEGEDLEARLAAEVWRPFDLESGPLVRLGVLRPAAGAPVLFLALHHMVSDFGSLAVMARDLGALYAREIGRPAPSLAPMGLRYTDYVRWQEEWLAGSRGERLWDYWREALAPGGAEPPYLDLPSDRPRPAVQTWDGGARVFRLGAGLAADLQSLARRRGATLYMALLAAFEAVLARYTGQSDLVIGSPTTGRSTGAVTDLVGYFVNPVALRVLLPGEPTFQGLLDEVRRVVVGAFQHQDFPFPVLAERLQPQRDRSRPPLLDVVFTFQKAHGAGAELGGFALGISGARLGLGDVEVESLALAPVAAPYSLDFMVAEIEAGLGALLRFNTGLFDGVTMDRLAGHYQILLQGALADPEASLWDLPLLTAEETRHLLTEAGREVAEWPDDVLLHEFFEAQARRTPDAVALIGGTERLTYRELDERADRMARRLRAMGVRPETRVGVFLQRTPRLLIAMLGILKAGGAYVPLDPAYPQERIEAILEDAQAPVVITEEMMRTEEETPANLPELEPPPVRMGRLAYVIYTSGSTGRPKGVAIEHRSASALMHWSRASFSDAELKGVLASTSICFDMSVFELFAPLAWGGTVILADNALALPHIPAKDEVTLIDTVPSAMAELLRQGAVPESVRTVNLGGEPLRGALARGVHALGTVERLLNLYGPSEDTTFSTVAEVGAEGEPTIGRILTNGYGYVVDRNFGLVPVGVPGELYLGGAGVSRGYLGRPDLTAERYVPDPFSTSPGERLYKTGDLIRWRPDGELEYLGRLDHQVKVRGFRVELGEIEAALLAHPEIEDAAVLALGEGGDRRLVAYVVGNPAELRGYLKEKLPEYMVPSAFVALDALPLTPNGKIDRRALAKVEPDRAAEAEGFLAPRTPTEERLAAIWCEVLGLERVGVQDDFFDLGGHSLLATQLVSRLRESFGVELPLRRLFEVSTVESLAAELAETGAAVAPPLRRVDRSGDLPLSFAQERMWVLNRLEPESPLYNIPGGLRLRGRLDVEALRAALREIVRRHETLRTTFAVKDGRPVQVVAAELDLPVPLEELDEADLHRRSLQEARQPFDLTTGPLLRARVLRLGEEEHVLLVTLHHIVADGWSIGVLLREISALYAAFAAGRPSPLPELEIQYADFAVWQRQWLSGEALAGRIAWWRESLDGAPMQLELPADRLRPPQPSYRGATRRKKLPALLPQGRGATPFMAFLAALGALFHRYTGQEDILLGSPVASRDQVETEELIGFFVNTLVLRVGLAGDPGFGELLERVRDMALGVYSHQDVPFEKLVEELAPQRDPSRTPLFQVVLALQNAPAALPELPGLAAELLETDPGVARFDLTLFLHEAEDGFDAALEHALDLYESATADRMLGHFETLLAGALADPARPVSSLPLLTEAESRQLLEDWTRPGPQWPDDVLLHEFFEAQVRRTPDAIALIGGEERLTYRELDERADRMARYLRTQGVGPEVRVGVFLQRTPRLLIAMLGILKAGGAYVPLDPAYPRERVEAILEDAQAPVVITEEMMQTAPVDLPALEPLPVRMGRLAYVIYTSGSTGRPKGVAIEHRSASALMHWSRENFSDEELKGVLASTSICFDMSVFELFAPLAWGGTVILADNALALPHIPAKDEVTLIDTVPSAMAELLRQGAVPKSVRTVNLGGEPLRGVLARGVHALGTVKRLTNLYGPSEDTTFSTIAEVGAEGEPTIGRILDNGYGYVVDRNFNLMPVGVPGELYVGGAGVSRGYLGRPDLTAERYIPDPFSSVPGTRLYKTGDLIRWRPDGELEYLGRLDHQVKVRGFRVELGEIETALLAHPDVQDAAVLALGEGGERRLVAYVVGDASELRGYLQEKLPEYMVPSAFVGLDALPLTPNGKIDRRALAKIEPGRAVEMEGFVAPRTATEVRIAEIWTEVLGLDKVGVQDDFFELGGHSLLATQLVSRVREIFGVELPLRRLFEVSTVESLAAELEGLGVAVAPPLRPVDRSGDLPMSFAQERLWFLDQLEPGSPLYNLPVAARLAGPLDVEALTSALGEIVRRHEALRTVFAEAAGRPVQRIAPWPVFELPVVAASAAEVEELLREEARTPFDLGAGRLVRARLLRLAEDEHILALTYHHIAADGWSTGVFVRELSALYTSFAAGQPSPLPELAVQYADFAVWQREWLQGETLESQLAYWRTALAGLPPALDLPTDRPRPATRGTQGAYLPVAITGELVAAVRALAQDQEATPFMVLLAGLQALLSRVSGQDDLAVGSVVANRNRLETEPLIGFFVNTLVLRGELAGDPGFRDLLRRTRAAALGAYAHQDVPFEKLVEELAPQRDPSRTPLFQVALALQNAPAPPLELPGLHAERLDTDAGGARFDLTLLLQDTADGFVGSVEYATDLFDAGTVERLLGHYRTLLEGIVADPDRPVADLPLLTREEARQLLAEAVRDTADWPRNILLHEFFEAQARRTPDAIALIGGEERLTYRELDARSDHMARRLRAMGVGPETRVGVFLQRTPRLLVAMLGILKAGGAYVPLDPAYPRERVEAILEDAQAPVVITEEMMQAEPADLPELEPLPVRMGRLAYVIYTSGSTGRPKGVAIEHRSASALMCWSRENFSDDELKGVLASTSICFDMSVFELFAPLAWGGTVILADNALALPQIPAKDEVTLIDTVPSAMAELLRQGAVPKSVKTVNLGGEPLRGVLARGVHALGTVNRLLNLYGPSEDTTFSTIAEVGAEGEPTIGRLLTNGYGYIVDRNFSLMPVGVPGELYVGGVGVSRGYLGRPDLTAERYVPDPFSTIPGERLYKTGDLIRSRPDGELEYLGRLDHQVKVRGFRVELGEIEAALLAHQDVQDAAVLALGEGGDRRLVAYVVGDPSELRGYLKEKLPEYMVPSVFVALDALPLTPNGKIDRRALAKIEPERPVEADGFVAPRTATEVRLAEIWSEVLDLERVGVQDDFFDLGGHSLLATQLVSRVRETFGVELPLRRLFEVSTVETLAVELEGLGASVAPPLRPVDRSGDLPMSFAQERLWFLDRLEPGSPLYNIPAAMRLVGRFDVAALTSALGEIVRRHEALRTVFAEAAGRAVQRIAPWQPFELPVVAAASGELERLLRQEARTPFDLSSGRLMRARLLRLAEDEHVLAVTFHHIAADGWSIGVFLRELSELYKAFAAGRPSPLPELAIQYGDFAVWQREWLQGEALEEQLSYWRTALAGLPPALDLPTDRPRPAARGTQGAYLPVAVTGELAVAIRSLAQAQEATPFMVLLAGLQALLSRVSGQDDLAVGSVVANRGHLEIEPLIGFFVNTLVLRGELAGEPDFRGLLRRTRAAALGAYAHQDVPFEKLVEELAPQRDPSRTPLFQVALALQNAPAPPLELPGLQAEPLDTDAGGSRFDLTLLLRDSGDGFVGSVEYAVDLFDAGTVERLLGHYRTLLEGIVAEPGRQVADLPLLTEGETRQLLTEAVRDTADWPRDILLHEFFEAQARRTPDAVALICGEERLTYRELAERADRMARRLRALGVGPEVRVGVFLRRTPRLLVSMLGILEAGGAYVPIDPAYPRERVEAILGDSLAPVVISEAGLVEELPADLRTHLVRADKEAPADLTELEPLPVRMGRLAYVIYTSGSTGRPKGVAIEHRSVSALMHWSRENFSDAELKGVLASTSICFDMSVFELFAPLAWGGTVILAENALALPDLPAKDEVTLIDTVPSAMAELLRQGAVPTSVRTVNLGGEPLRGALARGVHALGTVERLTNLYGPSEDTTFSTIAEVGAEGEPTIGRLLTNGYGYVVDRNFNLMPVGVPGELYVGGAGVSRGYLGRPDLTAERYVPDPFSTLPGERLYKTGDLIRWRHDGELEYLGRLDHQVKVRGFRVELGEIEAALLAHPDIQDAAVLALGEGGDRRLVAYVVGDPSELRGYLKDKLPEYMVPSAFVALDALPLTPNGKIDRRALAKIEPGRVVETEGFLAPRTATESRLAEMWAEVLGLEKVGVQDDFFDLGGHSLLATQLVSRVRETFGVELPLRRLFEVSTVESLAVELEGLGASVAPSLRPVDRSGDLPMSFAQERLWFLDRLEPGSPLYNIPAAIRLTGRFDVAALASVLGEIVRRHEALRTVFAEAAGVAVQRVAPWEPFELPVVEAASGELERLLREEARTPFDLGSGRLMRARLLRLAEDEHVLAVTFHHIAADGWSIGVFLSELSELYKAFAAGRPSPLPELAIQYGDFAVWQRGWFRGEALEEQLAYWRTALAGLPPALDLPTDRPRPAARGTQGAYLPVAVTGELAAAIRSLAQDQEATPFMVLLAGLQALLSRVSGQDDLAVGSVVANRGRLEIEPLIGFFVNTLVLRGELAGEPDFRGLLRRTRAAALGAYAHQDVPFEKLVEELAPQRDPSRTPLFQVALALQNAPAAPLELPGLQAEPLDTDAGGSRFDLTLLLRDSGDGFVGSVEYAVDLFDASTVERLLGHYRTLLEGIVADPGRPVTDLLLLTEGETRQLLAAAVRDTADWPQDVLLHEFFETQARRTPDAIALIGGEERLTYRELDERADRMGRRLRVLGVGPEVRVGVFLRRTPRLLISMLGILKAGGAYVPIDPAYPRERVEAILGDSQAPVVISEAGLVEELPAGLRTHLVRADKEDPADLPELEPLPVRMGRLAYVIYTSGSTGRPKGVAIEHRSASALMCWSRESFSDEELKGVLASTSVCFDMSVFELFAPLAWGGTVILAENALALPDLPAKDEVTLIDTVPSAMAELLRQGAVPESVKTVNLGGEPLRGALARGVHALGTVERLLNLYGPSEDTTFSTIAEVGAEGEPTIGRLLTNGYGYIVDRNFNLMPVGVPGELYVGGAGVSRGYLGRPDLTAERYVPDPFSEIPGQRLYKTGDLIRQRPDGELEYLGRLDHQVKVRGFRVELGEIEAALLAHPDIQDAAVLALGEGGDRRLVAYIVSDPSELRGYLKDKLPEYMVPSVFVSLDALPLTPNGKIDRRALAKIEPDRTVEADSFVAPRTATEARLAEIWSEILGLQTVGVQDDFFDLGGHSLLATQLVSRIRETFGIELSLRRFFEVSTVESLAAELAELGSAATLPVLPVDRSGDVPLSFAQERLWFLDRLEPGSPLYNMPAAMRLVGPLDVTALSAALGEIVRRHEALRTVFAEAEGRPVQRIAPWSPFELPVADLSRLPESERDIEGLIQEEARAPFDLAAGRLARALLIRLGEEEHVIALTFHHIASDAWSIGIFLRELSALYAAGAAGRPSPLPEPPVQYMDFAVWQREWLQGETLRAELAWWKGQLAGAPPVLDLPLDRPRPAVQSFRGARARVRIAGDLYRDLEGLARRSGATPYMVLLAAYAALLGRLSGQEDVVVGSPVAGRTRREAEELIGCFVNTLALRVDLAGDPSFEGLLGRVRERTLSALAHQDLPFEKLVEELAPERSLSHSPVFQVMFALQTVPLSPSLSGVRLEPLDTDSGIAKFDLSLDLAPAAEGGFSGWLEYNRDLFDAATVERLAAQLGRVLKAVAERPDLKLSELPLLSLDERRQLLEDWSRTPGSYPLSGTAHGLFAEQALKTPDKAAVVGRSETLTFRHLDEQSSRLAQLIKEMIQ